MKSETINSEIQLHRPLKISGELINFFKSILDGAKYDSDTLLYYKSQTPVVAFILLQGSIKLSDIESNRRDFTISKNQIIGLWELLTNGPSPWTATAIEGSQVLFFDRSSLLEFLDQNMHNLSSRDRELKLFLGYALDLA